MKNKIFHLACACVTIAASFVVASPQTSGGSAETAAAAAADAAGTPQSSAPETRNRASADETFELHIVERRIAERDFAASTAVEIGEETARGLLLRVGVGVGADEITVLLRNVRGNVRFRATLNRVLERLNARPTPVTAP